MRHFLAYHNAEDMGYSSTTITDPHVRTSNNVAGLEGITVWLIAGEGPSPKSYYLASRFIADTCKEDKYPGTRLPHEISGRGQLFGLRTPISGTRVLELIQSTSANFLRGFHEIQDASLIGELERVV